VVKLPYHTGVLEDAPTGPGMVLMPGGGRAGREELGAALFPPAGNFIEGDPVGTADEVHWDGRDDADAAHSADAAGELFKGVYPRLAGWVRRLVDDDDTAHEIASEAFVRLLSRWTKVENPQSYLYMIATNLIRDHWRKTERERRAIRSVTAGAAADPVAYPVQDVDVRNLIASLPPRLRDPFLLHYYGGFGIREVATLLHRPEGTIKADLFAARARLKTALGERDG
jgi:RNA polymerase sigma-70 factor (ECF subfamily)